LLAARRQCRSWRVLNSPRASDVWAYWANYERLPAMADELVQLNPDLIFSFSGEQAPISQEGHRDYSDCRGREQ